MSSRAVVLSALLGATIILPGCGGGESFTAPTPVAAPRPSVTTVIAQTTFTSLPPVSANNRVVIVQFATAVAGTLDITVDWTFDSNDVDLNLFQGTLQEIEVACPAGVFCQQQVANATTLAKPEKLSFGNASAGPYVLQIVNFGTTAESGTVEILLTSSASAASISSARSEPPRHIETRSAPALGSYQVARD